MGSYEVLIRNATGFTRSKTAVLDAVLPTIGEPDQPKRISGPNVTMTASPTTVETVIGIHTNVVLRVDPKGTGPFEYQWSFNGEAIDGATAATVDLGVMTPDVEGDYSINIRSAIGEATSEHTSLEWLIFDEPEFFNVSITDSELGFQVSGHRWTTNVFEYSGDLRNWKLLKKGGKEDEMAMTMKPEAQHTHHGCLFTYNGAVRGRNNPARWEVLKLIGQDGACIVTVLPDSGVKYLTKIYNDEWMTDKGVELTALCEEKAGGAGCGDLFWRDEVAEGKKEADAADASARRATEGEALWSEEATEEELRYLLDLAPTLVDYHRDSISGAERVHSRLQSPEELAATFASAGAAIDIDAAEPMDFAGLSNAIHAVMDNSVRSSHPLFLNQLYAGVDPVGVAAEWLASTLNANVHTFEVAPVLTEIEKAVLAKTARMWLSPPGATSKHTPPHDGLMVPGGSLANMYSMILARDRAEPEARTKGASGNLVAFCSEQSHYSYRKSAMVMGLGSDNMIKVPCDERGEMIPEALEREVIAAKARGKVPFYVGTTAGSTVLGAYDDYHACADVCERHGMWMHVDGAWGGAAALSAKHRSCLDGFERADSFCWNPHKMLGLPLQCSIFVAREPGSLAKANGVQADYLFQPDKNNAGADLGDRTIQCGRKADALKIWLAWKFRGDEGWAAMVDRSFGLAQAVEEMIRERQERDGSFALASRAQCANVGFWYVPPRLRPFDPAKATTSELAEIGFVAPKLKDRMQREGDAMIGFQPIESMGMPNFFRLVLPNARHLSREMLSDMLDRMDDMGREY